MKTRSILSYELDGDDAALLRMGLLALMDRPAHQARAEQLYVALTHPSSREPRFLLAPIVET